MKIKNAINIAGFVGFIFFPNMLKKDQSLARYPEFADYKAQSDLLFPRLFIPTTASKQDSRVSNET